MRQAARSVSLVVLGVLGTAITEAAGVAPSDAERAALAQLKGSIAGQIVWESNRDGHWQLYTMNADGTGARRLLTGPANDTDACFSPDGKRLLFTRTDPGKSPGIWIMGGDGSSATRLIENASGGEWRKNGQTIQFLRRPDPRKEQWQTWEYDCGTRQERLLFPPEGVQLEPEIWSAVGNDDGTRFVAWSPRPRGTWVLSADGRVQKHVHGGCEGQVSPDQQYGYGVHSDGRFVRFSLSDGEGLATVKERWGAWSHMYFPGVSADANWLTYGACPPDQHDHSTSDYEIFVVPLNDWQEAGDPVRLTFNSRTDRWPKLYIAPDGSPAQLPDGAYDVAANRLTNPPPPPLAIFTFPKEGAKPDFGGEWGLWPQLDGCRATATFLAEDAQGGKGGSMRIQYTIEREPRSFSLWMTPGGKGQVNLSEHDRFAIYAKGTVPSFTLVVKDRNAGDPNAPDGIADYVVTGVAAQWQRFELPFTEFVPRKQGARVDWATINHVGVALIQPQNASHGTLQVDDLEALPPGLQAAAR
jgi:hypothetical protein